MSTSRARPDGATDAEVAAALAAVLALRPAGEPAETRLPTAPESAWRRATGPLPTSWPEDGWRGPARRRGLR